MRHWAIAYLFSVFLSTPLYFLGLEWLSVIINVVIATCFLYFKTKAAVYSIVFALAGTLVYISSSEISEYLAYIILKIMPLSYIEFILPACVSTVITIIISVSIGKLIRRNSERLTIALTKSQSLVVLLGYILTLVFFIYQLYFSQRITDSLLNTAINGFISLSVFMSLMFALYYFLDSVKRSIENANKQERLSQLEAYNAGLEQVTQEMRHFRHDYRNILLSMESYIRDGNMDGLKTYFTKDIYPFVYRLESSNVMIDRLQALKITELKSLVASKLTQAQERGIAVQIEVSDSSEVLNFDTLELTRIIGIFLDNAIEAALETEAKEVKFILLRDCGDTLIIVANTTSGPLPSVETLRGKGYSTKGSERGLGLYYVNEVMKRMRQKAVLLTNVIEGEFIQELRIHD
jgi:two-component system sensor histidine kinase AgrC